ncbi:group II intron reverse transcriptase/maturase [Nocardia sp. NBC_01730]|uniref:group II intron reverse transcriptase/maturase n=1 Tax=Nocardia sp. NBC_01730 TaxID=2975998 RepID=UPI002E1663A3|nr:group II intron reverse transcriptase/maturase [Nocardia sp. NBC_01730]WSG60415.1 group II intron reverse transcriptase/maturase [Nocardia sp. NBC_01730]
MSAGQASSVAVGSLDPVRALQHTLYRSAKADPGRRFHALRDKVYRRDVLWRAWVRVRRNNGAPGIDETTLAEVEEYGVEKFLDELAEDLKNDRWRSRPARRVLIPKPGSSEKRPLSIPVVRDRVVAAAVKIVLEPIFEAQFLPCSFGFRPKRSTHDALQVLIDKSWRGNRWVVETDIANCFSAIPHEKLMQTIEERVSDQGVLKLLRAMLRAGVMADGVVRREVTGAAQGGPLSPLLCNIYLHRLDRAWDTDAHGVLVRYCDDLVVMCRSRGQAQAALERLRVLLAGLGLECKESKTRIVELAEGGEGVDFLGFHNRLVRGRTPRSAHLVFLARWPSRRAVQHARDRIRSITARSRMLLPTEQLVAELNLFLRGWAGYFRYGNSALVFGQVRNYALSRLALLLSKRGNRRRAWGWGMARVLASPDHLGLISLDGIVVLPRPFRAWKG